MGRRSEQRSSLTSLAAARWCSRRPDPAVGMLLVAPPDEQGLIDNGIRGFRGTDRVRLSAPALVLASTNDPVCRYENAGAHARAWGASIIDVGPLGHINASDGLGSWQAGRDLLMAFAAGMTRHALFEEVPDRGDPARTHSATATPSSEA